MKNRGGDGEAEWRDILDDLIDRGLRTPEFLIIDGVAGVERILTALWPDVPTQRCSVHKHRNMLAHAPKALHEEVSADYNGMIYAATAKEIETRRRAVRRQWQLKCRAVADSLEEAEERLSAPRDCRKASGNRRERRTPSSGSSRNSSAASRRKPCCLPPRPPRCCPGECLPRARSSCARSMRGTPWPSSLPLNAPSPQCVDLAA